MLSRSGRRSRGQYFRKQWLDVNAADNSISLEEWIASDVGEEGDLLLQMDIEGAEYRNLLATLSLFYHDLESS